jgi:glucose-6-phosphate 1-dehydrogenase
MNPLRQGLLKERIPDAQVMIIFGGSGDLAKRKLLPALYTLARERLLPATFAIMGVARNEYENEDVYRNEMRQGCDTFARRRPVDDALWSGFARTMYYQSQEFDDPAAYKRLKARLEEIDKELGIPAHRLYYFATPPSTFPMIVEHLMGSKLVSRAYEPWTRTRVIVEKPFGRDLESAQALNRKLKQAFRESQIYRIDHYLGKETVQNMLAFRFGNGIFEPLWNQRHVEQVQITAAESVGVEGRGGYFEEAGILRDMVQNHLFQILCLTAMEPPVSLDSDSVRDEKVKLLRSLRPIVPERVDESVVRAQYAAGHVLGRHVPGYRQEPGVAPGSVRETYVALRLMIDNWRWGSVPFYLRTAKRMPKKVTDISIRFRDAPHLLFGAGDHRGQVPNVLTVRVQPDEGISLHFGSKIPGPAMELAPVNMEFRYGTSFGKEPPEAYERLILDAMLGESTLFIRDDETEASWQFITQVLQAWEAQGKREIPVYPAGAWGPEEADAMLAGAGHAWRQP